MADESKFKISLRENGEHSLKKSIESFSEYDKTKDQMLLKDSIMFLHHGIELLMKELLVRHSTYLIFEDLKDLPKKQKDANKRGMNIFNIERPPKSVSYEVAISRVDAFLNYPEFDDNLSEKLTKLNNFRNQLEHYAIEVEREEVVKLLDEIHEPILKLFESHLGPMSQLQTPYVKQTWAVINNSAKESLQANQRIATLMRKFDGQNVSGHLFGVSGQMILPKFNQVFTEVLYEAKLNGGDTQKFELDVLGEISGSVLSNNGIGWLVEAKIRKPPSDAIYKLHDVGKMLNTPSWLVVFDTISANLRSFANHYDLMITGLKEFEELEKLIN